MNRDGASFPFTCCMHCKMYPWLANLISVHFTYLYGNSHTYNYRCGFLRYSLYFTPISVDLFLFSAGFAWPSSGQQLVASFRAGVPTLGRLGPAHCITHFPRRSHGYYLLWHFKSIPFPKDKPCLSPLLWGSSAHDFYISIPAVLPFSTTAVSLNSRSL